MDWRRLTEMLRAGQGVSAELKNLVVCAKNNGGVGIFHRPFHELIIGFKNGTAPHFNTFELASTALPHRRLPVSRRKHHAQRQNGGTVAAPDGKTGADDR